MNEEFKTLDGKFKDLVSKEKLNIATIEDLMLDNIEEHKARLKTHIEELLLSEINEKELISKKNKNGKKKDSN